MPAPVCLVTGVGSDTGTGTEIVRRFAVGGYQVAMLARGAKKLKELEQSITGTKAYPCDVANLDKLVSTIAKVKKQLGPPRIVVHNAQRSSRGSLLKLNPEELEKNFRISTTALLYLARETIPDMLEAGRGSIMVTGNISATRGKAEWGFFASTKASQRILAEAIAREYGPQGIHVAYFIIDAMIDNPLTRPVLAPDKPDDFFAKPNILAEEIFKIAHQNPSAWSFRVELRPSGENW